MSSSVVVSRTNYRTTGDIISSKYLARGYKSNVKSSTSAYVKVSTGLASPLFGIAFERASATVVNRFKKLRYARATGSYLLFRLYRLTWTSSNKFKETLYTSSATIQFNWLAFEA